MGFTATAMFMSTDLLRFSCSSGEVADYAIARPVYEETPRGPSDDDGAVLQG